MKSKKNKSPKNLRFLYRLHRKLGIVTALFIVILSVTGIMLNHNAQFGLNKQFITSQWILKLYGKEQQTYSESGYPTNNLTADQIILDIHTGRILGKFGPFFMDIIAVLLIILSGTGLFIYIKKARKNKKS